jgi:hypothetical protein
MIDGKNLVREPSALETMYGSFLWGQFQESVTCACAPVHVCKLLEGKES